MGFCSTRRCSLKCPRSWPLLLVAGGLISYTMNAGAARVALASVLAFALSESADALLYHARARRHRPSLEQSNTSNLLGAAVDSVIFPVVAFGGFPVAIIAMQFFAKVLGGLVWSLVLNARRGRTVQAPLSTGPPTGPQDALRVFGGRFFANMRA